MPPQLNPTDGSPFPIPGGWSTRTINIDGQSWDIVLPADPDAFLEDPATLSEHERSGYMPYWPYLWPAAVKMARLVLQAEWPRRQSVLEIGCGIGLVGLAALARGDDVTFSDYRPEAVQLAVENAKRNGFLRAGGKVLDWTRPAAERFPVILGCDVIYERSLHAPVLNLTKTMLAADGCCWLGDAARHTAADFTNSARAAGFQVQLYDEDFRPVPDHAPREFRLIELRRASTTH